MALAVLAVLAACSDDPDIATPEQQEREMDIGMTMMATRYEETTTATTRSWTPPSPYRLYTDLNDGYYENFVDLSSKAIDVFFTSEGLYDTGAAGYDPLYDPLHGRLRSVGDGKWKLSMKVEPDGVKEGKYYLYGFIPRDAADDASIAMLAGSTTYKDGAVLTIQGMKTVASDACVIIGAKEGPDEDHDGGLTAGDFCFNLKTGKDSEGNPYANYLYLLFDHLSAALSIEMKVDKDYDMLRTIRLKELHLQTATEAGAMKKKMNVTVTLNANAVGDNPISSVVYEPDNASGDSDGLVYHSTEGLTLTPADKKLISHFIPLDVTTFILTSTYDVYDKNATSEHPEGNLVRKDCKATNTIPLSALIGEHFEGLRRGYKYVISMTIKPTYLYVLSEPDLNNPSVEIGD